MAANQTFVAAQSRTTSRGLRTQIPVMTSWRRSCKRDNMRTASSASAGLPSIRPSITTVVSAPSTTSPGPATIAIAFSSATRTTYSSGDSQFRTVSSTSATLTVNGIPALRRSSLRRGDREASTNIHPCYNVQASSHGTCQQASREHQDSPRNVLRRRTGPCCVEAGRREKNRRSHARGEARAHQSDRRGGGRRLAHAALRAARPDHLQSGEAYRPGSCGGSRISCSATTPGAEARSIGGGRRDRRRGGAHCRSGPAARLSIPAREGNGVKITEQQVRYVADLANLKLTEAEVRKFQADLDEILGHVDKLNEIDTSSVEPMAQVLYEAGETATLREDREVPPLDNTAAVANAPAAGGGYFKVPLVIER